VTGIYEQNTARKARRFAQDGRRKKG
jgi:hypothetical protein